MPAERLSMRKIRELLRLRFESGLPQRAVALPQRAVAESLGLSQGAIILISENIGTKVRLPLGAAVDSTRHLLSGRSPRPRDRAERADQAVIGGEPVPCHLAGLNERVSNILCKFEP